MAPLIAKPTPAGRLDLSDRSLAAVPADVEPLAPRLSCLDLSNNNLSSLALPPLPLLQDLRLGDNLLDAATVQRAALPPTLRLLDLSANLLVALPPRILGLRDLAVLRLDRQRLRGLPRELSMLPQLVALDAGFNELGSALALAPPGLPRLRRLVLRSNGLTAVSLDANALPALTELDLAGNKLEAWPTDVSSLLSLRTLTLASNRLKSLVSDATMPTRRMWVPSAGVHQLEQLVELSVAQNHLADLPASLSQLRALALLDARCNPLSPASLAMATAHCRGIGATLRASSLGRVCAGVLLGDDSSAWHRPTLLRAGVTHLLSVGAAPPVGVPAERLAAKLPEEARLLGLVPAPSAAPADAGADGADAAAAPAPAVTAETLRRAFRASALRCHPDKLPEAERPAAAAHFARMQDAYRALGRAVAFERRRLPQFESIAYGFVELPAVSRAGSEPEPAALAALAAAFRSQLPPCIAFAAEARARATAVGGAAAAGGGGGELLVHAGPGAAGCGPADMLASAVALAIVIATHGDSLAAATRRYEAAMGRPPPPLPPPLVTELELLAAQRLASSISISSDADAAVPPPPRRTRPARPAVDVSEPDPSFTFPPRQRPPRGRAARSTAPSLVTDDPFGGTDPFAFNVGDDEGPGSGAASSASAEPVGGAAHFSTAGCSDEGGSSDGRNLSDDDAEGADARRRAAAAAGGEAGWGIDHRGRRVYRTGSRQVYGQITEVIVEYDPGARISHDGDEGGGARHFVG